MRTSDHSWKKFGQIDPYFGVQAYSRFRNAATPGDERKEFFEAGENHVACLFDLIHQRVQADFTPARVIDFGCGVGRITMPLARRAAQVVGVDVSADMLAEASRNCSESDISNVEFVESDDDLSGLKGQFDLIHSYITFQHIRPIRGELILRRLLEHLGSGGIGAVHITFASTHSRWVKARQVIRERVPFAFNMINLVEGRPWSYPLMEMNYYNLNHIFSLLNDADCREVVSHVSDHGGFVGVLLVFRRAAETSGQSWP
jgi:trans-aconitate methyltransferase